MLTTDDTRRQTQDHLKTSPWHFVSGELKDQALTIFDGPGVEVAATLSLVVDAEGEDAALVGEGDRMGLAQADLLHKLVLQVRHMTYTQSWQTINVHHLLAQDSGTAFNI